MSVTKVPMKGINTAVDTAAGDDANIGWTAAEGLILTGQGSTNDITIKNDADTAVLEVATGQSDIEVTGGNIFFGTANKGVYLGVTSATAANLLDDYEEGIYTAAITCEGNGTYGLASGYDTLSYTKVGRMCMVFGTVNAESESSPSGVLELSLPFTPRSLSEYQDSAYTYSSIFANQADSETAATIVGWITDANGAIITYYDSFHGTGVKSTLLPTEVDTTFSISVMLVYMAN